MPEQAEYYLEKIKVMASQRAQRGNSNLAADFVAMLSDPEIQIFPEAIGDLNNQLAICHMIEADYEKALHYLKQAEVNYALINNKNGLAIVYCNIGNSMRIRSEFTEAIEYNDRSLALFRELNYSRGIATVLGNNAIIQLDLGNLEAAIPLFEEAIELHRTLQNFQYESMYESDLAKVFIGLGRFDEALVRGKSALATAREHQFPVEIASALATLGFLSNHQAAWENALEYFQEAQSINEQLGNQRMAAIAMENVAVIHILSGDVEVARKNLENAFNILQGINDLHSMLTCISGLAEIAASEGDFEQAYHRVHQSLEFARNMGNKRYEAMFISNLAELELLQGEFLPAVEYLKTVETMQQSFHIDPIIVISLSRLVVALCLAGKFDEAQPRVERLRELAGRREWASAVVWIKLALTVSHLQDENRGSFLTSWEETMETARRYHLSRANYFGQLVTFLRDSLVKKGVASELPHY